MGTCPMADEQMSMGKCPPLKWAKVAMSICPDELKTWSQFFYSNLMIVLKARSNH